MSRTDLAQFLGLALETICRELAKFSEQGIIEKKRRTIRIIDPVKLDQLAEGVGEDDSDFAQPLRSATKH